jgi:hypothetical protein
LAKAVCFDGETIPLNPHRDNSKRVYSLFSLDLSAPVQHNIFPDASPLIINPGNLGIVAAVEKRPEKNLMISKKIVFGI